VANGAAVLHQGKIVGVYHKIHLPNYGVFDEDRYFAVGRDPDLTWRIGSTLVGVSICKLPMGHRAPRQQLEPRCFSTSTLPRSTREKRWNGNR
jgi:hypothetical protein